MLHIANVVCRAVIAMFWRRFATGGAKLDQIAIIHYKWSDFDNEGMWILMRLLSELTPPFFLFLIHLYPFTEAQNHFQTTYFIRVSFSTWLSIAQEDPWFKEQGPWTFQGFIWSFYSSSWWSVPCTCIRLVSVVSFVAVLICRQLGFYNSSLFQLLLLVWLF